MTPLSGKNTWSSELSASIRTCPRWQRMCSSSGISCLRLEDGRWSKSRLRGQFDGALIREPPRLDTMQQPYGIPRRRAVEGPRGCNRTLADLVLSETGDFLRDRNVGLDVVFVKSNKDGHWYLRRALADVTALLKELHRIVNEAIRTQTVGDDQAEGLTAT